MIDHLKTILKQPDTVLFIGSGVSLWSGLPTWYGLLNELKVFMVNQGIDATLVEQELIRGELLQAASYGFDRLTDSQILEFLKKACRVETAKPHEIHRKIISLGPTCYVTTNYDRLIELTFQRWLPDVYYRKVINRQLTETAEIVGARSSNFLFKLHGDVEDSKSIILTREQYRALNVGGELHHALETVKTLMVSRPFVYLGFGLRDPDFLYVKDLLANTYKMGARDHYAIMADISEQEKDYWRRNFGIHLISYSTTEDGNGKKDHSRLLELLNELNGEPVDKAEDVLFDKLSREPVNKLDKKLLDITKSEPTEKSNLSQSIGAEFILSLARHASKYSRSEHSSSHIPLLVHPVEEKVNSLNFELHQYYGVAIEKLLDNGPEKLVLIGVPGSGKSYALRNSMARISSQLSKTCLEGDFDTKTIVPIFADLKLYKGHLVNLLENTLPIGIGLDFLLAKFKVKIYLDAFNEMPRQYVESNIWDADLREFLTKASNASIVISSRTADGLDNLDLPIFNLDLIEDKFLEAGLEKLGLELKGVFKEEVFSILQRPFFYKLIFTKRFPINPETYPVKIYSDLLNLINTKFQHRFDTKTTIVNALSSIAFTAIEAGEEVFEVGRLEDCIEKEITAEGELEKLTAKDAINWLVSEDFLVPLVDKRIAFFHQSVTEFLAANRLAELYERDAQILTNILTFRRWDQAIFLTLSLLKEKDAQEFLETVINIDFQLALSSLRYLEYGKEQVTERLLLEVAKRSASDQGLMFSIADSLQSTIPITERHIDVLKKLIGCGNSIGGAAVIRVLDVMGQEFVDEALTLLVKNCDDYNFCSNVATGLEEFISEKDLTKLVKVTDQVQERFNRKEIEDFDGFDSALGDVLKKIDPRSVYKAFFRKSVSRNKQQVRLAVLCEFLRDNRTAEGLEIAAELLLLGVEDVATEIYFITNFADETSNLDYSIFTIKHLKVLVQILSNKDEQAQWALSALKNICLKRKDFFTYLKDLSEKKKGILKASLLYILVENGDYSLVFDALESLTVLNPDEIANEPLDLLSHLDEISWQGNEALFVKLLKLRNIKLAYELCDSLQRVGHSANFTFDIGPISWWLDWFLEFFNSGSQEWMFEDRVSSVLVHYTSEQTRQEFISEFNKATSKYREVIADTLLWQMNNLSLDELTEEGINFLLSKLKKKFLGFRKVNALTNLATEEFVTNRIIPLLKSARGIYRVNILELLDSVGKRHGRRYL